MADQDLQRKLDAVLGRALRDSAFREKLISDPRSVAEEVDLTPDEVELISGGLKLGGGVRDTAQLMYCTEKTCNEKGGARVVAWTPVEDQPLFQTVQAPPTPPR
jgi:hypothetical protein